METAIFNKIFCLLERKVLCLLSSSSIRKKKEIWGRKVNFAKRENFSSSQGILCVPAAPNETIAWLLVTKKHFLGINAISLKCGTILYFFAVCESFLRDEIYS